MPRRSIVLDNAVGEAAARADDPPAARVALYPHQRAALHRMLELERGDDISAPECPGYALRARLGILGDKPGAGKSFVILATVLAGAREDHTPAFSDVNVTRLVTVRRWNAGRYSPTSVVVVPHGLTKQWTGYLERYMPETSHWRVLSRTKHIQELTEAEVVEGKFDVLVVTATMAPALAKKVNGTRVNRVFFDECDSLDMKSTAFMEAGFYWFVSASFHNLLTPRGGSVTLPDGEELYTYGCYNTSMRYFIDPLQSLDGEIVRQLAVFCESRFVDRSLGLPDPVVHTVVCRTPFNVRMLSGNVRNTVIRALNAGDLDSAVSSIGATADTETNLVSSVLERYRRELRALQSRLEYIDDYVNHTPAQRASERARCEARSAEIQRSIDAITERVRDSVTCPICHDDLENKTIVPCCQNSFCLGCLTAWLSSGRSNPGCPMCKSNLELADCLVCRDEAPAPAAPVRQEGYVVGGVEFDRGAEKIANLERVIRAAGDDRRFIIFSEYDQVLERSVADALVRMGVRYGMLKRNVHTINRAVADFRSGFAPVLLVNSAHYGCGMNLPEATDVVIMHRLAEGRSYAQVVGRAQRTGRSGALRVWKMFNEFEAEEDAAAPEAPAPP